MMVLYLGDVLSDSICNDRGGMVRVFVESLFVKSLFRFGQ